MPHPVHLHVGTPKSGTTYLQGGLWAAREQLRDLGVLYPGRRPFDQNRVSLSVRAGRHMRPRPDRAWSDVVAASRSFDGATLLSNEWYLAATHEQADAAVEQLGRDRVQVLVTTRSPIRLVPAAWQESLKIGRGTSWAEFLDGLDDSGRKWSWDALDPARVARRWARVVGPERVHVVTMPADPVEPALLWERFLRAIDVEPADLPVPPRRANESLTVQAARALQELGPALLEEAKRHDTRRRARSHWLRNLVVREVLVEAPGDPIAVGPHVREELARRAAASVADLRALGCRVTGDLDELLGGEDRPGARHPDDVDDRELLETARHLSVGLLRSRIALAEPAAPTGDIEDDDPDTEQEER